MLITSLALLLLNYFSAKTTRELMFRAKYASAQDKIQVVASAFSGVDPLTPESAEQVISVLGNINAARLIVTNAEGTAVYDSSENQNAIGQRVLKGGRGEGVVDSDLGAVLVGDFGGGRDVGDVEQRVGRGFHPDVRVLLLGERG